MFNFGHANTVLTRVGHAKYVLTVPKLLFPAEPERDLPTKMERILRISAELMYSGHSGTENAKKQSYST